MLTVTTSWDDGDVLDERLAALLERYGVKGTFYVTKQYRPSRLSESAMRSMASFHEIGAHTLTHPDLRKLPYNKKMEEIAGSKKWLEGLLGKGVPMFCYPSGLLDNDTEEAVRRAGFLGARTTELGRTDLSVDRYQMPTTVHVYPMPLRKMGPHSYYWGKLFEPFLERFPVLRKLGVPLLAFRSFGALFRTSFDIALDRGTVFHFWGHSWEIEKYGMWRELERALGYIGNRQDCRYITNGELIKTI